MQDIRVRRLQTSSWHGRPAHDARAGWPCHSAGIRALQVPGIVTRLPRRLALGAIRGYQVVFSPWTGRCCRFSPSCSCYAYEAVRRYGVLRGGLLSMKRVLRCHPWHAGGIDPVP